MHGASARLNVSLNGQTGESPRSKLVSSSANLVPLDSKYGPFSDDNEGDPEVAGPFLCFTREKQESVEETTMMYKPFILLLGIFLGSYCPVVAQTPPPQIVLAQEHVAPIISILPTVSTALPVFSFLLFNDPKSNAHFSRQLAGVYQRDFSLDHLSPITEVRTLILSQSSLPLVQFWGGRLELDAFESTLRMQTGQLGLVGTG